MPTINQAFELWNDEQEEFLFSKARNNRFGGGFGNGKTSVACIKAIIYCMCFPGYRVAICRQTYKILRSTTMQTFFKFCPKEFIKHHDVTYGLTIFRNGSCIYWLHLDTMDDATAKGFEINALVIDQPEEVSERIYLLMDARVGRWTGAKVPSWLLTMYPNWPRHPKSNLPLVNSYCDVLDNPTDDEFHWIDRFFSYESEERLSSLFVTVRKTDDNMNDAGTIEQIKKRDPEWVDKYYYGKKTISRALLHNIDPRSVIDPDKDFVSTEDFNSFISNIIRKGVFYRILDHGETKPTCVLFCVTYGGQHFALGEYYLPNVTVSVHRQNIYEYTRKIFLASAEEEMPGILSNCYDLCDPSVIEGTRGAKNGRFWTVGKEYADTDMTAAPPIYWKKADNNEMATRNRINELLSYSYAKKHPVTGEETSSLLYFVIAGNRWPHGAHNVLLQTKQQKKRLIGEINGKRIYSDERDPRIPDHAYDTLRYYVAAHSSSKVVVEKKAPLRSFANLLRYAKKNRAESMSIN